MAFSGMPYGMSDLLLFLYYTYQKMLYFDRKLYMQVHSIEIYNSYLATNSINMSW